LVANIETIFISTLLIVTGLKNATAGCCGAGILNAQYQCGTKVPTNVTGVHQTLCKHPSEYLYWDLIHNTEYVDNVIIGMAIPLLCTPSILEP